MPLFAEPAADPTSCVNYLVPLSTQGVAATRLLPYIARDDCTDLIGLANGLPSEAAIEDEEDHDMDVDDEEEAALEELDEERSSSRVLLLGQATLDSTRIPTEDGRIYRAPRM
ncbi:hypothetical protein C8F01DRAFT_1084902 [Mycena amicta]|nr:hypothetical protein C8F01DRAFT_1084902 [Mycena amicta]